VPKTEAATELQEADPSKDEVQKPPFIATLNFFNTYSPSKGKYLSFFFFFYDSNHDTVLAITTQLYVGLSNGHVYQFDLTSLEQGLTVTQEKLGDYLTLQMTTFAPVSEIHIIDLKGNSQAATAPFVEVHESPPPTPIKKSTALSKESSRQSSDSGETEEATPKTASIASNNSNTAPTNVPSKRMAAIGKGEYKQQESPHFIITVSPHSISVFLSGYNVRLFFKQLSKETEVIRSEIIKSNGKWLQEKHSELYSNSLILESTCLCLLLNNGKLVFYSLPAIEPLLEISLPNNTLIDRLQEASLSLDGRVVYWTGKYELEQYSFIHKPNL
jgi:hypothetical protein